MVIWKWALHPGWCPSMRSWAAPSSMRSDVMKPMHPEEYLLLTFYFRRPPRDGQPGAATSRSFGRQGGNGGERARRGLFKLLERSGGCLFVRIISAQPEVLVVITVAADGLTRAVWAFDARCLRRIASAAREDQKNRRAGWRGGPAAREQKQPLGG